MKRLLALILCCVILMSGCAETEKMQAEPMPETDELAGKLRISELMPENRSTIMDEDGDFSAWLELENCSGEKLELSDWGLSDDAEKIFTLPQKELQEGERILVYLSGKDRKDTELHTDFKHSRNESIYLVTPMGSVSQELEIPKLEKDRSYALTEGSFKECKYPTPGFPNTREGFESFQSGLICRSPLVIGEVMSANKWDQFQLGMGSSDWVELRNISDEDVKLSDYYLSRSSSDYYSCRLPEKVLKPGGSFIALCREEGNSRYFCTGFKLGSAADRLFLSTDSGLADYISIRDVPYRCSYGRMDGENGFFYFDHPSPGGKNSGGMRYVSETPRTVTPDGVYKDTEYLDVELEGEGTIYYTLDGSKPSENSNVYEGPIRIDKTSVIRACSLQEGAIMSRALTLSYIINENHSLPVLSIVSDDPKLMRSCFSSGNKQIEIPGSACFYEGEDGFRINCGIQITGNNSRRLRKKSMKIDFRGAYGDSRLNYDVFKTGHDSYSSLSVRAGQDNHRLVFRQEIWQDLCLQMTDKVITQHSKFCILYLNGEYYGIYCLKDDIGKACYADARGVDEDSVESVRLAYLENWDFTRDVFLYSHSNDMSKAENYDHLSKILDMDAFIDWIIIEGVSGNIDLFDNVRFFMSPECGGRWQPALFDMDHSLISDYGGPLDFEKVELDEELQFKAFFRDSYYVSKNTNKILSRLLKNEDFRQRLIERYSEVYDNVLSNENILKRMDYYEELLRPEVARDWERWRKDPENWPRYIAYIKTVVNETDWERAAVDNFCKFMDIDEQTKLRYFP